MVGSSTTSDPWWYTTAVCVDLAKLERTKPKPQNQLLLFALTLQSVNQKAVHMNIIMWLGFLFSL